MIDKIKFINDMLYHKKAYYGPSFLYKYRLFDEYTFDMLENNYVFLCQAKRLDDKTECDTSYEMDNYYSEKDDALKMECIDQIIEMVKPFTSDENFIEIRNRILKLRNKDGNISPSAMLEYSFELEDEFPEMDTVSLVNNIVSIPDMLERSGNKEQIDDLLMTGIEAKERFGICSLAQSPLNYKMWEEYTNNYSGYCIEYDVSNYKHNNIIFPVIYSDDRDTNIIKQVVANFLNVVIEGISNGEANTDKSQFVRLFLTKNTIWEYQDEWRIIDRADTKLPAPTIKRIILGKNVEVENAVKMKSYCSLRGIEVCYLDELE